MMNCFQRAHQEKQYMAFILLENARASESNYSNILSILIIQNKVQSGSQSTSGFVSDRGMTKFYSYLVLCSKKLPEIAGSNDSQIQNDKEILFKEDLNKAKTGISQLMKRIMSFDRATQSLKFGLEDDYSAVTDFRADFRTDVRITDEDNTKPFN